MDVHDDCGNEGSPWRRCTAVWERIGTGTVTVTELLMPCPRLRAVAKAVSVVTGTGGQGRAGSRAAATACNCCNWQQVASWHYYLLPSTDVQDRGEWGCPAGVVWEESSPVRQQLEAADPDWPYGTALA